MTDQTTHESQLALTARWIAGVRALENRRDDHLISDPLAAALAGPEGEQWAAAIGFTGLTMLIRTRYFDDFLKKVSSEASIRQVVIMAPGMDTRAFRLEWPAGTTLYELDQPEVFTYKETVLASVGVKPACERHTVAVDLIKGWKEQLIQAGFDPQRPAAWLLEGFLFYIPDEAVTRLLDEISALAAPGSALGFDTVNRAVYTSDLTRPWIEKMAASGVPWVSAIDEPVEFLAERRWQARATSPGESEAHYGRWPFPVAAQSNPAGPHHWLVTAIKE